MTKLKLKQTVLKCLLNYRIIFAYFMATTFFFMHYFVTSSQFESDDEMMMKMNADYYSAKQIIINERQLNHRPRFNSKKLLNYDGLVSLKQRQQQHHTKRFGRLDRLLSSRIVVNKLAIDAPSILKPEYDLKNLTTRFYSQIRQDQVLEYLLNQTDLANKPPGLFVEVGAYDGETWSNSLFLERRLNWSGLLVEPSPENYHRLRLKNRPRAYSINSCVCSGNTSVKSNFIEAGPFGALAIDSTSSTTSFSSRRVTCHPLSRILDEFFRIRQTDTRVVDYLSLDIEGNERSIVETFPWHRYRFKFINIEYNQSNETYKWLREFLARFGYVETVRDDVWFQDVFLAHETVLNKTSGHQTLNLSEFIRNHPN